MVMVEMELEPRKAVNMAEKKKRKIKNVTIAVKLTTKVSLSLFLSLFVSSCTFIAIIVTSVSTSRLAFEQSHVAVLHF
jgi:hypothetical protein